MNITDCSIADNAKTGTSTLGHYTTVFQAETHAVTQCGLALKKLDSSDEHIYICLDSQAVLTALCNSRVVSNRSGWVSLTWVQAHSAVSDNEQLDHLTMTASCQPYISLYCQEG